MVGVGYMEVARGIAELGVLVIVTAISVTGGAMMFRSVLKNNDKLAPVIDRMIDRLDRQERSDALLQAQAEEVARKVEALHKALECHDTAGADVDKKTLVLLESIAEQLAECLASRKGKGR